MKFSSLQKHFGFLLLGFMLLIALSVWATFSAINAHAQDSLVINLAGRQRKLIEQMTRLAYQISLNPDPVAVAELNTAIQTFDMTLQSLEIGGPAPYQENKLVILPATKDGQAIAILSQIDQGWFELERHLQTIQTTPSGQAGFTQAVQAAARLAPGLVSSADQLTRRFEKLSVEKTDQLRSIQWIFLAAALILLGLGAWLT